MSGWQFCQTQSRQVRFVAIVKVIPGFNFSGRSPRKRSAVEDETIESAFTQLNGQTLESLLFMQAVQDAMQ